MGKPSLKSPNHKWEAKESVNSYEWNMNLSQHIDSKQIANNLFCYPIE